MLIFAPVYRRRALVRFSMFLIGAACLPCVLRADTQPAPAQASTAQTDTPPIVSDTSQLEVLNLFSRQADATAKEWYPRIVALLGAQDSKAPAKITLVMDFNYKGVAATSGTRIAMSPEWIRKHPDDLGMVVHELTHVIQGYPNYDPVWLVEGIADWVRWFNYEPTDKRPHPNPDKATARDSYRTTATFLDWTAGKYDKSLVKKLNKALKDDTYKEGLWQTLTGKTLDDLNMEWIAALKTAASK